MANKLHTGQMQPLKIRLKEQRVLFLMLLPGVIAVAVFAYAPLFGWIMAFTDYRLGDNIFHGSWVGFRYFREFFFDTRDAGRVLRNTVSINILGIVINLVLACLLAILINEMRMKRFRSIVQSATLFPFFISLPIVYILFSTFLSYNGVLNNVMLGTFWERRIDFLGSEFWAWPLILTVNAWRHVGYNAVLFLAALAAISPELFESAEIDGANRFQRIRYITLPHIVPTMMVLLLLNLGWIFSSQFEQFYLFTNAINRRNMEVFDVYIFRFGIGRMDFSYATAVGVVRSVAQLSFLVIINFVSKKVTGHGLF